MFNAHPLVVLNPKTNTYTYKHEYQVRSPDELLKEIKMRGKEGSGISIKQLKETFPTAVQVIEEFEKEGKVLVMRTSKEAQPRLVFWNDVPENQGGKKVEDEFLSLWADLHNPVEADLLRSLERDGLQATASESLPIKPLPTKKKGKKPRTSTRPAKITNTHLAIDLSKDFVKS
ncbi:hypothetical protein FRC02_010253 [Tulasnella sp. 418]|nr:hypothetical protein FRC02_010253 [Tulasnella sp. 418]